MKILVTGAGGQVGSELIDQGMALGHDMIAADRKQLDISSAQAVNDYCHQQQPQAIINAAAYTAVDKAESDREQAFAVNAEAAKILAQVAVELAIPLLHISTDYVFDGNKQGAYIESDQVKPINVYGESKYLGEQYLQGSGATYLVLRTSWVFGCQGNNFVKTMLRLAGERDALSVVDDQYGCPTYAGDIAAVLLAALPQLIARPEWSGIYHYAGNSALSWYDFAGVIFTQAVEQGVLDRVPVLSPIPSSAYPTPAARPHNSWLCSDLFCQRFQVATSDWRQGVNQLFKQAA